MESRTVKRKKNTKKLILDTAIELFIEKRSGNVTFDDIANRADLARRTVFNHFKTKEELIYESAGPILSNGICVLKLIEKKNKIILNDVFDLCLELWGEFGRNLYLLYSVSFEESERLKKLHHEYIELYRKIFKNVSDLPKGLSEMSDVISSVVYKSFVPILASIYEIEDYQMKFRNCMKGLIKGLV